MPNQSGKIILVLVLLVLVVGAAVYFFLPRFKKQGDYLEQTPNSSTTPLQAQSNNVESQKCALGSKNNKEGGQIWEHLSKDLQSKTYQKGIISAGEATYEITLLKSSDDCEFTAFLIELVARGGGAYNDKDYQNRGVYIFDSKTKKVIIAMLIPKELVLDVHEYGSNIWVNNNLYKFVLSESIKEGKFIKWRYLYDIENNKLTKSIEET